MKGGSFALHNRRDIPESPNSHVQQLEKLTKTESLIVAAYLSRQPPPKAKDLAAELGVSIKTVYKALYKYRKLRQENRFKEPSEASDYSSGFDTAPDLQFADEFRDLNGLVEAVFELKQSIDRLNATLNKILDMLAEREAFLPQLRLPAEEPDELPVFIKDNPWLDIIRSRA